VKGMRDTDTNLRPSQGGRVFPHTDHLYYAILKVVVEQVEVYKSPIGDAPCIFPILFGRQVLVG